MFDNILLEPEQVTLFFSLVGRLKEIPRDKRVKFIGSRTSIGTVIILHPALLGETQSVLPADIEALDYAGLLNVTYSGPGSFTFSVTPTGMKYYEVQHQKSKPPSEQIEEPIRHFVDGELFRSRYPTTFAKWSKAESHLWSDDSRDQLSVVGHLCRESMQEFATALVDRYKPLNCDTDKSHHISMCSPVITAR